MFWLSKHVYLKIASLMSFACFGPSAADTILDHQTGTALVAFKIRSILFDSPDISYAVFVFILYLVTEMMVISDSILPCGKYTCKLKEKALLKAT